DSSYGRLEDLPTVGFGYGRRICPGLHAVRNFLWILIGRILWAFNIEFGLDDKGIKTVVDPMASTDGLATKPLPF
ncbi:hypothetical protein P280DRAFT_356957, partial [Massarina eburnea CBS 473.64]